MLCKWKPKCDRIIGQALKLGVSASSLISLLLHLLGTDSLSYYWPGCSPVQPGICTWAREDGGQVYMPCNISSWMWWQPAILAPLWCTPGAYLADHSAGPIAHPDQAPSASWWRGCNALGGHLSTLGWGGWPMGRRGYAWVYLFALDQGTVHLPKGRKRTSSQWAPHMCIKSQGETGHLWGLRWPHVSSAWEEYEIKGKLETQWEVDRDTPVERKKLYLNIFNGNFFCFWTKVSH